MGQYKFPCPFCKTAQEFSAPAGQEAGFWSACPGCGSHVYVAAAGAFQEKPRSTVSGKPYWIITSTGETVKTDAAGIQRLIRQRKATPADQAAVEEGGFMPLGGMPEFAPMFAGFTLPVGKECVNHPGRPAIHACPQCHRRYCTECAVISQAGGRDLRLCPACRGLLRKRTTAFSRRTGGGSPTWCSPSLSRGWRGPRPWASCS